jgi:hypothetical protein
MGEQERGTFTQIAQEYYELMKRGATPDSEAVQELTERATRAWLKTNMRQRQLEQLEWNPQVTRAWFSLGAKLLTRSVVPDDPGDAERLHEFMQAARAASRTVQVLMPIVQEAMRLSAAGTRPNAAEARKLAERYLEVCKAEGYGDPQMHARWITEFVDLPEPARNGWKYLARL